MRPRSPRLVVLGPLALSSLAFLLLAQSPPPRPRLGPHHALADPIRIENLTVWPVVADAPIATGEFLSLAEAEARGAAKVYEKGSGHADRAEVNELVIENRGKVPIVAYAGTILKGGKQDRQLGGDVVIAAGTTVSVDAFCVEHGRWSMQREGEATSGVFEVTKVVASKRVRAAGQYGKDQGKVWQQVDKVNAKTGKAPATSTFLATVDEKDQRALAVRTRMEAEIRKHFTQLAGEPNVVGFAYAINGEPLGARAFANSQLLTAHFEPFLKTMSLEAQVAQARDQTTGKKVYDQTAPSEALLRMVRGIETAKPQETATQALNKSLSRANQWGGHSACLIPVGEAGKQTWVTLTEDWTAPPEFEGEVVEEMMRLQALGYTGQ